MPSKKKEIAPVEQVGYSEPYLMRAERQFIPTTSLSLLQSICQSLPEEKDPPELAMMVEKMPGLYATFLGKITAGSTLRTACLSIGLPYQRVLHWMSVGAADVSDDIDTYCGRLVLDIQRAAAIAISDAEERVHRSDPSKWLGRGPAKDFHRGRYWKENQSGPLEDDGDDNPLDPLPYRPSTGDDSDEDSGDLDLIEAMKVLENHNIVQSPEFVNQAKKQFGFDGQK